MKLQFVENNGAVDNVTRRAIRSHVMRGKNSGRKIIGRGRANTSENTARSLRELKCIQPHESSGHVKHALVQTSRCEIAKKKEANHVSSLGGESWDSFLGLHTSICEALYPYAFCRPTREAAAPWFELTITSPAFLHCLIAMTSCYISFFHKPGPETLEATRHLSQTFRLVNRELAQQVVPQEQTFAVVTSLTMHANLVGDTERGVIHRDGLVHMLSLRPGGLAALRMRNVGLVHKICRADLDCALLGGTATRFGALVAEHPEAILGRFPGGSAACVLPSCLAKKKNKLCVPLSCITRDVLALCRWPGREEKLEPFQYQDVIISISQRLVDFSPLLGPRPTSRLDDVWQLGLLCFMSTIMYTTACLRSLHCGLLMDVVRMRLEDATPLIEEGEGDEELILRLWMFLVCAMAVDESSHELGFHVERLREVAYCLKLDDWGHVRRVLQPFPWLGLIHDESGERVWKLVNQCG